jgi:hypothetical protein
MGKYYVSVEVMVNFEIDADSAEEAENEGWDWETYKHFAEVSSIHVDDISDEEDEEDEDEVA